MTSLVVSGGVDCGRRQRNVYEKNPRRYAKDNRTVHLTACSDKSAAYVTNNEEHSNRKQIARQLRTQYVGYVKGHSRSLETEP